MQVKYSDCQCEDYPCCGHYDIVYGDEGQIDQDDFYDRDDYFDEEDCDCGNDNCMICNGDKERNESRQRYNAFGQKIRAGAPELPGDHYGDTPFHEEDYE